MKILFINLLLIFSVSSTGFCDDKIYIKVGEAKVKKSLVALPPFQHLGSPAVAPNFKTVGAELYNTLLNDLDVAGYFSFVKQEAFIENLGLAGLTPDGPNGFKWDSWKPTGAEFLIKTGFSILGNEVTLEGHVYHVTQQKLIFETRYKGKIEDLRLISHNFSNDILEKLTGKKGMFTSRLVVASDRAGGNFKEIYIMDWDGYNAERVSFHKSISISPNWAPDGNSIIYTSFLMHEKAKVRNPDLVSFDLKSKRRFNISSRNGINSGATFSPDGKFIYLTISQKGTPDIFKMSVDGETLSPVTNGPGGALNVEPAISLDGKKLAFSSDRSGRPMIYTMNIDGTGIQRITFAGKYNSSPAWSPDGKKIAFAGHDLDHFDIFIMDSDGQNLERLTSAKKANGRWANNEDPIFSPDGRFIMFTSDRTGVYQIYVTSLDGTNERRITTDRFNYWRPKWNKAE